MLNQRKGLLITAALIVTVMAGLFAWKPLQKFPDISDEKQGGSTAQAQAHEASPAEMQESAKAAGSNELGRVPILVYHMIDEEEGRWTRTPDNLRRDLQELYDRNYVLIPLNNYLSGSIDIPAGKSPAVITFDDSTSGHFRLIEKENGNRP